MIPIRKIAVPILNQQISEKFERASAFKIYTLFNTLILKEKFIHTTLKEPESVAILLKENGVTEVLARKLDLHTIETLNKVKINVFVGVIEDHPDSIIQKYIKGNSIMDDKINNQ